jgi:hypothetical protein
MSMDETAHERRPQRCNCVQKNIIMLPAIAALAQHKIGSTMTRLVDFVRHEVIAETKYLILYALSCTLDCM